MPIHNRDKFSGNIKSLFQYAYEFDQEYKLMCVATKQELYLSIKSMKYPVVPMNTKAIWYLLRAKHIIIDGSYPNLSNKNFSLIQLWHGTGFKNVGLLNHNVSPKVGQLFLRHYECYKLIVANSENDRIRKNDSFKSSKSVITGSPKNDMLFSDSQVISQIKKKYGLETYQKILAYIPTYRDFETVSPFSESFWKLLNDYLIKMNQILIVKKHPWDKFMNVPNGYQNILDFSKEIDDVQELLMVSDILISDYSGVVTDYAIFDKPILFYFHDFEQYKTSCRDMYYDIFEILPGPFIYNEKELFNYLTDISWYENLEMKERYKKFKNMFHKYSDGNSSKRVLEAIKDL